MKGAQKFTIMRANGDALSKKSNNINSKVEITFNGPCPKICAVAPGDSSDFQEGDEICTMVEILGNCVVTSSETSTYAVVDSSIRALGYWFLGLVSTIIVITI